MLRRMTQALREQKWTTILIEFVLQARAEGKQP